MDIKYQVTLLEPGGGGLASRLQATLLDRLNDLGAKVAQSVVFLDASSFGRRNPKAPIVGVYFGGHPPTSAESDVLETLLSLPAIVIPVVENLGNYPSLVPEGLRRINGLLQRPEDPRLEEVASITLEALALLRQSRRLFISYRRSEASGVAGQLHSLLDERGFDVFLDTHAVRPGEPFQEVLWHRLADSDAMVLLDTPDFLGSQWTRQELAEASAMSVGLLQLVWPDHPAVESVLYSGRRYLTATDFEVPASEGKNARLEPQILNELAILVESIRARSLAQRHNSLVTEFCRRASEAGVEVEVQPNRYILTRKPPADPVAVIPAIGVPTALQFQEIADLFDPATPPNVSKAFLVYDHRGIRDRWMAHLRWLDQHLPIKSFRVTEADQWLARLV